MVKTHEFCLKAYDTSYTKFQIKDKINIITFFKKHFYNLY